MIGIERDADARSAAAPRQRDQARRERLPRQADGAEVHDPCRVQPARWEPLGIEVEVRAVVADEEVARGRRRGDEREQRRVLDLLQEAQVEPGFPAALADLVAEDVAADGAGEAGLDAEPRRDARQVPW